MFIKAIFNDALYKMSFKPLIFQIITVYFYLGYIVYIIFLLKEALRVTSGLFSIYVICKPQI